MLFNSVSFIIFFPIVVLGYFVIPPKYRNVWLLAASYYFYMSWSPVYLLLILFSTVTTWLCGLMVRRAKDGTHKNIYLAINIFINLLVLFHFKYQSFFESIITDIFPRITFSGRANIPAVVGISFYTFQSLGYSIDVYRGKTKREKNFLTYALFVSFFPQLVAGPIERSDNLLPQFYEKHTFDYGRVTDGLVLMAWGYFKKMVIADGAARIVDTVYADVYSFSPARLFIATLLFAFVIYGDFSGYSDIAIGAANVMGFRLTRNFRHPYFAKNIGEFWDRWHISLTKWFTDYLYIPLGGSRKGTIRTYINVLIVFLVSGLWHGAAYTYVVWGLLNGIYSVIYRIYRNIKKRSGKKKRKKTVLGRLTGIALTFISVDISWIFFRSKTLKDAFHVFKNIFLFPLDIFSGGSVLESIGFFENSGVAIVLCIIFMLAVEVFEGKGDLCKKINRLPVFFRWTFYYTVIALILFFGSFGQSRFIYFRF